MHFVDNECTCSVRNGVNRVFEQYICRFMHVFTCCSTLTKEYIPEGYSFHFGAIERRGRAVYPFVVVKTEKGRASGSGFTDMSKRRKRRKYVMWMKERKRESHQSNQQVQWFLSIDRNWTPRLPCTLIQTQMQTIRQKNKAALNQDAISWVIKKRSRASFAKLNNPLSRCTMAPPRPLPHAHAHTHSWLLWFLFFPRFFSREE